MTKKSKWYSEGLRFKCTECGKCCTGGPGVVWVTRNEIETIAAALNLSIKDFCRQYIRRIGNRLALKERVDNYDCIFLKDKKCRIYKSRPTQCRTFPFWPMHLKSPKAWEEVECEGIDDEAPLIPFEEIERQQGLQKEADGT